MLFLFHLEHIVEYLGKSDPSFLRYKNSAMIYLLGVVCRKLNSDYAIPCEFENILPTELPIHWSAVHEFILSRDILPILNLLREATLQGYSVKLKVVDDWLFGIELS